MSPGRCRVLVSIPAALLLSQPPKVRFYWWQIKTKQAQPLIPRTNLLTQALYMGHSGSSFGYRCIVVTVCVLCFKSFMFSAYRLSPKERSGATDFLAASRFSWWPPFENLELRFCQMSTFPAIWKSWEDFVQDFVPIGSETKSCWENLG